MLRVANAVAEGHMCGGIGVGGAQKHISVAPCGGVVAKPLTAEYRESMATKENLNDPSTRCSELSPISGYRSPSGTPGSRSRNDRKTRRCKNKNQRETSEVK